MAMFRADAKLWEAARDLTDLGQLTAFWLEGELASQPPTSHYGPGGPDEETEELVPVLTRANRAGFLTHCSQPGRALEQLPNGSVWPVQRAYVEGFINPSAADELIARAGQCDVHTIAHPVNTRRFGRRLPGLPDGIGRQLKVSDVNLIYPDVSDQAYYALLASTHLTLAAPKPGPDESVWTVLNDWAITRDDKRGYLP